MFRLPVATAALIGGALGVVGIILGVTTHGPNSHCFIIFGAALVASCIVALISASSARTTRPGEPQPGVAFEGMAWWALLLVAIFLIAAAVLCGVIRP
jgi:hypothetical protein